MENLKVVQDRYHRHRLLPEIGDAGQARLEEASVLVLGCGALGSIQAQLVVRAGVGRVRIVDRDLPEEVNLQRQLLFDEDDIARGAPKAVLAEEKLRRINSRVRIEGRALEADRSNLESLIADVDLVLDASDNFEVRYALNDACVKAGKPWIYGGVIGATGMTLTIVPHGGPCLRCLFRDPPAPGTYPTTSTAGVLSAAPAVIGSLQVAAAFKYLIEGAPSSYALLIADFWRGTFRSVEVSLDGACACCGKGRYDFLESP